MSSLQQGFQFRCLQYKKTTTWGGIQQECVKFEANKLSEPNQQMVEANGTSMFCSFLHPFLRIIYSLPWLFPAAWKWISLVHHVQLAQLLLFDTHDGYIDLVSLVWHQRSSRFINDNFLQRSPFRDGKETCGMWYCTPQTWP